jgi:hypothetical protein
VLDLLTPKQIPPAPAQPRALPLQVTDLLLIVIIAFGSMRLVTPLVAGLFAGDGTEMDLPPGAALALTLTLLVIQNAILLATVQVLAIRKYGLTWADLGLVPPPSRWVRMGILIGLMCFTSGCAGVRGLQLAGDDRRFGGRRHRRPLHR